LEVLLALAIAGLIAAITVPFMLSAVDPADRAAEDLRTFCRQTRREAILSGEPKFLLVTSSGLSLKGADQSVSIPPGWMLEIRRSTEKKFRKPTKGETWEFNGEGLCEPITLRMAGGGQSYEMAFDPLTALEPAGG
jgi:type II secretory pathway pseudopilin PulG